MNMTSEGEARIAERFEQIIEAGFFDMADQRNIKHFQIDLVIPHKNR